jgi:tetratricopeptide (TPR) repeat protein
MDLAKKRRRTILICALLSAATLATFWPVIGHDFINYDDGPFVTQNAHVLSGLNWENVGWAFRTGFGGNWQPITWLSHMLDAQCFGLKPGWHHLSSLLLHMANTVLLFLLFQRMTGAAWRSAAVAALFALHPLHVESVAWVAERKDVLSAFFFILTLLTYVKYAETSEGGGDKSTVREPDRFQRAEALVAGLPLPKGESRGEGEQSDRPPTDVILANASRNPGSGLWYLLALALFASGLASKPMLVTLPFVLLLLDYWPLRRLSFPLFHHSTTPILQHSATPLPRLMLEKLPFLALSAASCVVTFVAQRASESVFPLAILPLAQRATNALVACVTYLEKTFWPAGLAVFYPLPDTLPAGIVIVAGAVALGITAWAIGSARRSPHVTVGWFWFLGMLVPIIGLVQVGLQARADRYTYLPLIGVFIMLVWEVSRAFSRWRLTRAVCGIAAGLALLACAVRTRDQLRHWQNSESVFRQAIAVTKDNWLAHYNLAGCLTELGRFDEALAEGRRALAIYPDYAHAHHNLGNVLFRQGQVDEAIAHWRRALEIDPRLAGAHNNLGNALLGMGRLDEAVAHLQMAVKTDPDLASAHNNLGNALLRKGRLDEAIARFQEAVRLRPNFARAHCNLGAALLRKGQVTEALAHYQEAIAAQPANPSVLTAVAWVLATCPEAAVRNGPRAVELTQQAERLPGGANPSVLGTLAAAYAEAGRFPEAVATAQRALELATAQNNPAQVEAFRAHLRLYQAGSPFRDQSLLPHGRITPGS